MSKMAQSVTLNFLQNPYGERTGFDNFLTIARVCTNMNFLSDLSPPLLKLSIYSGIYTIVQFTETDALCHLTTSVGSSQFTIYVAGWSEVNQFAQPS